MQLAGVAASPDLVAKLEAYYRLLATWNERINLTSLDVRGMAPDALDRLLIEPLIAARYVRVGARNAIDIGSGGGSPGIPFALGAGLQLLMVEVRARKCVFLREALRVVGMLDGVVETSRYEELLARPEFLASRDVLTVRAVRIGQGTLAMLQQFVRPGGSLFLFSSADSSLDRMSETSLAVSAVWPLSSPNGSLIILQRR
jgi:16S rRNA (guanine(527)-N(7))-methyltransferase RsmG